MDVAKKPFQPNNAFFLRPQKTVFLPDFYIFAFKLRML